MGMSPLDVRQILEGYDLEEKSSFVLSGTVVLGSTTVVVADASGILPLTPVTGAGIPPGAFVFSVNPTAKTFELSEFALASGAVNLTFAIFAQLSDSWLTKVRDEMVIPWVESVTKLSFSGVQRITEYHSGTGSSLLILDRRPIIEVHSINLITNPSNWVYVSPTSVEKISEEGLLKLKTVLETWQPFVPAFPRGKDNIKVDYSYGFAVMEAKYERAVNNLVASLALGHIGSRTGGGSLSTPGYNRTFGERGKYSEWRTELERWAYATIRRAFTGMTGQ